MSALLKHKAVRHGSDTDYIVDSHSLAKAARKKQGSESPQDQAEKILDQARREAEQIIAQAGAEAENVRMAAYREGCQEAEAELEESKAALAAHETEIEHEASRQVAEFWKVVEPDLLRLSVEIAQKIVRREIDKGDEFILEALKAGLHQMANRHDLKLRLNSADLAFVREHKDELAGSFDGISSLEIIEDRRVSRGGWIVESSAGRLDGRPESQLKEAERTLLEALHDA